MHQFKLLHVTLKKTFLVVLLVSFFVNADAQRWKKLRQEVTFGAGTTWLLGDVGGYKDVPSNSVLDMNFKETSWGVCAGYNYYLSKNISLNGQFSYLWLKARDASAKNAARLQRNLDIQTQVYEIGILGRYYFIREKFGEAFRLKGTQNDFLYGLSMYATTGIQGLYFNPTGKYIGATKYKPLSNIGTEGQTVAGSGIAPYKKFTLAIPLGIGVKYSLGKHWNVGAEYMFRKAFSDYIDDVSGVYYDNNAIIAANDGNQEAGLLADPANRNGDKASWTNPGERRGSEKSDDLYMTFMFTVSYKILKAKAFKPRF